MMAALHHSLGPSAPLCPEAVIPRPMRQLRQLRHCGQGWLPNVFSYQRDQP